MKKDSFLLYTKYEGYAEDLSDEEFGSLMRIIFRYVKSGEEPEKGSLSPEVKLLFRIIKDDLDFNGEKYENVCKARSEAGKKGGRPKKEEAPTGDKKANAILAFSSKAKKADNEYEYDNEYGYDHVDDNDHEYEGANARKKALADDCDNDEVLSLYKELIGLDVTKRVREIFARYDLSDDLKKRAIEAAHDNGVMKLSYVTGVLDQYVKQGIKTLQDAENAENNRHKKPPEPQSNQYSYDFDDIERSDFERRLRKPKA